MCLRRLADQVWGSPYAFTTLSCNTRSWLLLQAFKFAKTFDLIFLKSCFGIFERSSSEKPQMRFERWLRESARVRAFRPCWILRASARTETWLRENVSTLPGMDVFGLVFQNMVKRYLRFL